MKYSLALAILCSAIASSNTAAILDKIRLAQTQDYAECIQNCSSVNFPLRRAAAYRTLASRSAPFRPRHVKLDAVNRNGNFSALFYIEDTRDC
jgi:hypothetical protein